MVGCVLVIDVSFSVAFIKTLTAPRVVGRRGFAAREGLRWMEKVVEGVEEGAATTSSLSVRLGRLWLMLRIEVQVDEFGRRPVGFAAMTSWGGRFVNAGAKPEG